MTKTMKPPTWSQAIDRFAAQMREDEKSALTIRNYSDDLNFFATWYEAQRGQLPDFASLTKTDLIQWKECMRHGKTNERRSSPRRSTGSCPRSRRF